MTEKVWRTRPQPPVGFASYMGVSPLEATLLFNRGVRHPEEIETYLAADSRLLNDPWLLPNIERGVAALEEAISEGRTVAIFGDFDADGITATAIVALGLRELGARAITYLPNRLAEGHGLNDAAVRRLADQGASLLVTVDCGLSAHHEVETASSLGIDTIITDHHTLPDRLPDARAVVHSGLPGSAYPYEGLTGAGLAFKLIEALHVALGRPWPEHLLGLAALGTVGDSGPLTGENRFIVKQGMAELARTRNPGLRALADVAGEKLHELDTRSLSFGLIPRINAAGRLGDASLSLDLLMATDRETAEPIARDLDEKNRERQRLTREGIDEAVDQMELSPNGVPNVIVVEHPGWSPGILGLIAGRLAERYYRPAIAVTTSSGVSRASARSIPEFDMTGALRSATVPFIRMGGHAQAAGFTVPAEFLPKLRREMDAVAGERLEGVDLAPAIDIDCDISLSLVNEETLSFVQRLSPFGQSNQTPAFLTSNARVVEARQVGKAGRHLKMRVSQDRVVRDAIAFGQGDKPLAPGDAIDLVYSVGVDRWGGAALPELTVADFRKT